ncbi:MAG: 2,3,4,5-tetrahydropyridine-2,6-dicarboxylate N-acetyltransferase, partial [Lachnospiraceae bacterium]|nr:2,3,4,5-tetrahydropyridine-2,6-dicarboxylate N-acetyltransferase [Lachnospiraceae bacterium]
MEKRSILQDGVSIGSNSVIVAPVHIGEDALIAASSCI